jgi:phosphatidylserine synthase
MWFILKIFVSAFVIAFASWLSGKKPHLAGFIVALPLVSVLSILFSYVQYKDMKQIDQFATSILTAVPLSLLFFVPFVLNRWLKLSFIPTYLMGFAFLFIGYFIHKTFLREI